MIKRIEPYEDNQFIVTMEYKDRLQEFLMKDDNKSLTTLAHALNNFVFMLECEGYL